MLLKQLPPGTGEMVDVFLRNNIHTIEETKSRLSRIEANQRQIMLALNIPVEVLENDNGDSGARKLNGSSPRIPAPGS